MNRNKINPFLYDGGFSDGGFQIIKTVEIVIQFISLQVKKL